MNNLYERIIAYDNLQAGYRKAMEGQKKFKKDAVLFTMYDDLNMVRLWQDLKYGRYRMGKYICFKVYEPKERIVYAPRVRDKIVQFAVHNIIKEIYDKTFIKHSYACQDDRGTLAAVNQLQKNLRTCARIYEDAWIVKFDVSKYFYSINHSILKKLLRKKITCKKTLWLLDLIIDSSPDRAGIPLGNITSQDFANIYLNELDQYVKRFLQVRYYVRYMDDAVIIVNSREKAVEIKKKIEEFVAEHLDLQANPKKTQIFPIKQGVNAYGYKIYTTHRLIREESKRAMKRRIKAMDRKLKSGDLELRKVRQAVDSWLGHARHSNSFNLAKKIFVKYPYIKVEGDEYFGNR